MGVRRPDRSVSLERRELEDLYSLLASLLVGEAAGAVLVPLRHRIKFMETLLGVISE